MLFERTGGIEMEREKEKRTERAWVGLRNEGTILRLRPLRRCLMQTAMERERTRRGYYIYKMSVYETAQKLCRETFFFFFNLSNRLSLKAHLFYEAHLFHEKKARNMKTDKRL